MRKIFLLKKLKSDLDIGIPENSNDAEYLEILSNAIEKLEDIDSDLIFFQAGVDSLKNDRYGKLNLTLEGLDQKRNKAIFNFARKRNNPVLIFMGGGYSKPIDQTVIAFKNIYF